MSRSDILRIGVQVRLRELEVERRQLLKLVGEPVGKMQTGLEILAATEAKPKHKPVKHRKRMPRGKAYWTPKRLALKAKREREATQ